MLPLISFAFTSIYKKIATGGSQKKSKSLKSGIVIPKCINQSDESKVKNAMCINQKGVKKNIFIQNLQCKILYEKVPKSPKQRSFIGGKKHCD